jgi:LysR family malonate utilization transcriptional regulator
VIDTDITFRKLEIFLEYMKRANIARTADALNISTVSVHRALHTLEEGIQCPLFTHKGRNLLPLPAANTLAEYAADILALMEKGIAATQRDAGVGVNRLKVGTMYSLTLRTVPRLIMGMKLRRPDLELDFSMGSNRDLLQKLDDRDIDATLISVTDAQIDPAQYQIIPLFEDEIYLAAPLASVFIAGQEIDLHQLQDKPFISLAEGFATYHGFQEAFAVAGFDPKIMTRVNDIFSMLNLVQAGVGYSLVPGRMRKAYASTVKFLRLSEPFRMRQTIALVFAHNRERDPNLLALTAESRMFARQADPIADLD